MVVEISLDRLMITHFLINLISLKMVEEDIGGTFSRKNRILASILGTILYIAILYLFTVRIKGLGIWAMGIQGIVSVYVMMAVSFRQWWGTGMVRVMEKVFVFSVCLGAGLEALGRFGREMGLHLNSLWILVCVSVLYEAVHQKRLKVRADERYCEVSLYGNEGSKIHCRAIVDSGNFLKEPISKTPVCVVSGSVLAQILGQEKGKGYRMIPYKTIEGKTRIMKGYYLENMEVVYQGIKRELHRLYIASLSEEIKKEEYEMILPKCLLEE